MHCAPIASGYGTFIALSLDSIVVLFYGDNSNFLFVLFRIVVNFKAEVSANGFEKTKKELATCKIKQNID